MSKPVTITKEMIDDAAFELVRREGLDALTARGLAKEMKCSSKPIFRTYASMDALKDQVIKTATIFMNKFVYNYDLSEFPFMNFGLGYILFARNEKHIFKIVAIDNMAKRSFFETQTLHALAERMTAEMEEEELETIDVAEVEETITNIVIYSYGLATLAYHDLLDMSIDQLVDKYKRFFDRLTT